MTPRFLLLLTLVLVQLAVPIFLIVREEQVLKNGQVFKFKTAPVDPVDAFRGGYVALRFTAENIANKGLPADPSRERPWVWVEITPDEKGFAVVKSVSTNKPVTAVGEVLRVRRAMWGENILLPFNRFYLSEKDAPKAELAYREHTRKEHENAYALVRIFHGRAAIENLYIEEKPIMEFLRADTKSEGSGSKAPSH